MSDEAVLYWCDPEKNTECRKTMCRHVLTLAEGGVCEATFNPAFALLDEHGKPMVYEKQKEWQRKKAAALAALKEREERMYRELISSLTYMYSVICRAKGRAKDSDLRHIADGAHSLTATAPVAEQLNGKEETANDKAYLLEAQKIDEQIEEITVFLMSLEIV